MWVPKGATELFVVCQANAKKVARNGKSPKNFLLYVVYC